MKNLSKTKISKLTLPDVFPVLLVVFGSVGLLASTILTLDKIHLLEHPQAALNCDINPIISCGSVIVTDQASAFGIPNPIIGIAGFAGIITIGVMLMLGARVKQDWFWLGLLAGTVFGLGFVHWLMFQTIFRIGALCPWCMVTWTITIPMFLYTLLYVVDNGHLKVSGFWAKAAATLRREHAWILAGWYALILAVIGQHFWYYWQTLL